MSWTPVEVEGKCPVPRELYVLVLHTTDADNMKRAFDAYRDSMNQIDFVNSSGSEEMPLLSMIYCNVFSSMMHGDVERMRENFATLKNESNKVIMWAMEGNNNIGNGNEESLRKFSEDLMKLSKSIENMIGHAERCIKISYEILEEENKEETKPKKKTRRGGKKHKKNKKND